MPSGRLLILNCQCQDALTGRQLIIMYCQCVHCVGLVAEASLYALLCLRMGAPWCFYQSATESIRFLYCSQGFSHVYEDAWESFSVWQNEQCGVMDSLKNITKTLREPRENSLKTPPIQNSREPTLDRRRCKMVGR